jgi:hypothetical protein
MVVCGHLTEMVCDVISNWVKTCILVVLQRWQASIFFPSIQDKSEMVQKLSIGNAAAPMKEQNQ